MDASSGCDRPDSISSATSASPGVDTEPPAEVLSGAESHVPRCISPRTFALAPDSRVLGPVFLVAIELSRGVVERVLASLDTPSGFYSASRSVGRRALSRTPFPQDMVAPVRAFLSRARQTLTLSGKEYADEEPVSISFDAELDRGLGAAARIRLWQRVRAHRAELEPMRAAFRKYGWVENVDPYILTSDFVYCAATGSARTFLRSCVSAPPDGHVSHRVVWAPSDGTTGTVGKDSAVEEDGGGELIRWEARASNLPPECVHNAFPAREWAVVEGAWTARGSEEHLLSEVLLHKNISEFCGDLRAGRLMPPAFDLSTGAAELGRFVFAYQRHFIRALLLDLRRRVRSVARSDCLEVEYPQPVTEGRRACTTSASEVAGQAANLEKYIESILAVDSHLKEAGEMADLSSFGRSPWKELLAHRRWVHFDDSDRPRPRRTLRLFQTQRCDLHEEKRAKLGQVLNELSPTSFDGGMNMWLVKRVSRGNDRGQLEVHTSLREILLKAEKNDDLRGALAEVLRPEGLRPEGLRPEVLRPEVLRPETAWFWDPGLLDLGSSCRHSRCGQCLRETPSFVQKCVERPLVIAGRTVRIRQFVAVTSWRVAGAIRAWFFDEFYTEWGAVRADGERCPDADGHTLHCGSAEFARRVSEETSRAGFVGLSFASIVAQMKRAVWLALHAVQKKVQIADYDSWGLFSHGIFCSTDQRH